MLATWISQLESGYPLTETDAYTCLDTLFHNDCTKSDIVKLLRAIHQNSETVETLVGFANAIQNAMIPISTPEKAIDVCGTGGSGKDRFNVSTAVAFILASLDITVAKHGNRGSKKGNGSFDFLEALGIPFGQDPNTLENLLQKTGLCFMFARQHHPALAKVGPARKEIGHKTIFNMIGPLCNPGNVQYQIIGTTNNDTAIKIANARQKLGTKKTIVIVGANGLDELSSSGRSKLYTVTQKTIAESEFNPQKEGLLDYNESDISGGSAEENAALFRSILSTKNSTHPIADTIALNAGAALYCLGKSNSILDGREQALDAIGSGKAWQFFQDYSTL